MVYYKYIKWSYCHYEVIKYYCLTGQQGGQYQQQGYGESFSLLLGHVAALARCGLLLQTE